MKENTTIKNRKNIKILLRNKLEIGRFIKIFLKNLGEILGSEKCYLCKCRFLVGVLGRQTPCQFPQMETFANEF